MTGTPAEPLTPSRLAGRSSDDTAELGDPAEGYLPEGLRPSVSGLAEEKALQAASATQLTDIRKAADSWRTGLGALTALVLTIFFIKGRESVFDISVGYRWILAVVLGGALATAVFAAWQAMKASFGSYDVVATDEIESRGGTSAYQEWLAEEALKHLRSAQRATILAVVLVVAAVLLTWFSPKPPATDTLVAVTTTDNQVVCGKLTGGIASSAPVQIEDKAPIALDHVFKVQFVTECPTTPS